MKLHLMYPKVPLLKRPLCYSNVVLGLSHYRLKDVSEYETPHFEGRGGPRAGTNHSGNTIEPNRKD